MRRVFGSWSKVSGWMLAIAASSLLCCVTFEQRQSALRTAVVSTECKSQEDCTRRASEARAMFIECEKAHEGGLGGVDWHRSWDCKAAEEIAADADFRLAQYRLNAGASSCYKENKFSACYELNQLAISSLPTNVSNGTLARGAERKLREQAFTFCNHACSHDKHERCCAYIEEAKRGMVFSISSKEVEDCMHGCEITTACLNRTPPMTKERDACLKEDADCKTACAVTGRAGRRVPSD